MKTVCQKDMCTGCMACVEVCPAKAISVKDSLKAYNAIISVEDCINCNLCSKTCQVNQPLTLSKPIEWYQGWAVDSAIRRLGSSGGVASELAREFIVLGGLVCTCVYKNGDFSFQFIQKQQELSKISGSKYVKSNPFGVYKRIKELLAENKRVLFIGLPCQVAALKRVVGIKLEKQLTTVDLICHGTPSPQILNLYLEQYGKSLKNIHNIRFREKNNFSLVKKNDTDNIYVPVNGKREMDQYSIAFLNRACYTENCYACQYAKLERVSDITLGDSWGSELDVTEKSKGISLILCQSVKGIDLLKKCNIKLLDVNIDNAVENNHQLHSPAAMPKNRDIFLEKLHDGKKFNNLVWRYFTINCIKQKIKKYLIKLHLMGGGITYRISLNVNKN